MPETQDATPDASSLTQLVLARVRTLFSLSPDTDFEGAQRELRAGLDFQGANLWTLILAILVASVGLDVNSTAVIIGAMLISPLMGPIVAVGAGLAMDHLALVRRAVRNLAIAATASICVSAIYFAVSPLAEVQSELLARTRPTLYDVLIAIGGGCAGAIASTRAGTKGNAIPGVAIATALMPPLCTAGFGLASGDFSFFVGALYLFLINSIFIALSTLAVYRLLGFPRRRTHDDARNVLRWAVTGITIAVVLPSAWVAWQVVQETRFQARARNFVAEHLEFPDRALISTDLKYRRDTSTISVTIVGPPLGNDSLTALAALLPESGLPTARLAVRQPTAGEALRSAAIEDVARRAELELQARDQRIIKLEQEMQKLAPGVPTPLVLVREINALVPDIRALALGRGIAIGDSTAERLVVVATWSKQPSRDGRLQVGRFLAQRLQVDTVHVVHETEESDPAAAAGNRR